MPTPVRHFIGSASAWAALSGAEQAEYASNYTDLSLAEAAEQGDFVAADEVHICELADETFTNNLLFLGSTTDATRRWVIRPRAGSAFAGDVTAGPLLTSSGTGSTLQMREDALIEDIRIQGPSGQTGQALATFQFDNNLTIDVKRCYISSLTTNDVSLILCGNQAASQLNVESCLIGPAGAYGLSCIGSSASINVRNSVFADCNQNGSVFRGGLDASKANITATNVVAFNNNNADFLGTSATLINCASSDSSAYGTNPVTGVVAGDFVNTATSDYHLSASSNLIGAGANLTGTLSTDIDGDAWPGAGAWDIGFDYYVSAAGTTISITDTATTAEALSGAISLALADSASGNDLSPAATVTFNLSDSGAATDVLNLLALITQSDSASGSDANPAASAALLQTDIGNAAEVLSLLALITQTDTATGSDALSVVNTVTDVISTIGTDGDYPTIAAWISAKVGNLVSANQRQIGVLKNQVFAEELTFSGWTCDADRYPMLMAESGAEFDPLTETGARIQPGVTAGIHMQDNLHLHMQDIGIGDLSTPHPLGQLGTSVHMFEELLRCSIYTSGPLGGFMGANLGGRHLKACQIKIAAGNSFSSGISGYALTNCTVIGGETGGYLALYCALNNTIIYNSLSHSDPLTIDCTGDYNAASDTSAPGANSIQSITSAEFVDFAGGDYHLDAASQLIGAGDNLVGTLDTDIDGDSWPPSGAWDIGMDRYVAPGTNDVTITDSVTISEALASSISLILTDSASGNDANPAATVTFNVTDSGNAADVLSLLALITQTETATGADALAIANQLTVADSALGADAHTLVVSFALRDSGSANDAIALITETLKTINDLSVANDAIAAVQVSVPVADAATGLDAHSVLVSLAIADSAAGDDAVTTLQALLKQINDAALGSDQVGPMTVQVQVPDASTAVDSLSRLTALFQVLDDAGALDTLVTFDSVTRIAEIRFTLSKRRLAFAMTARSMTFTLH